MPRWIARVGITHFEPGVPHFAWDPGQRFEAGAELPQDVVDANADPETGANWLLDQGLIYDAENPAPIPDSFPRVTTLAPGLPEEPVVLTITGPEGTKAHRLTRKKPANG